MSDTQRVKSGRRMIGVMTHLALMCLLMIVMCGMDLSMHPAHAYAEDEKELNNNTYYQLNGSSYVVTEDIIGKNYEISGEEVHIRLDGHSFIGGDDAKELTLFDVRPGCKLVIEGNGKYEDGIAGYGTVFKMRVDSSLELKSLQVSKAYNSAVTVVSNNVTISMDNSTISGTLCKDWNGAIRTSGDDPCNNLKVTGTLDKNGNPTSEINDTNQKVYKYGCGIQVRGDGCTVENIFFYSSHTGYNGGAINIIGAGSTIYNCRFSRITSKLNGGAIHLEGDGCKVEESTFTSCSAGSNGGAISIKGADNTVCNCIISKSESKLSGGAVYLEGNSCKVDGSTIESCSADSDGGAIKVQGIRGNISHVKISDCFSDSSDGGAISMDGTNNIIENADIDRCIAEDNGGAVKISGSGSMIDDSLVTRCVAETDFGGAVYVEGSNHRITGSRFYKNQSYDDHGGALYIDAKDVKVDNCEFRGNEAGRHDYYAKYMTEEEYRDSHYTTVEEKSVYFRYGYYMRKLYNGGAIYSDVKDAVITDSTFLDNCGEYGGAIYFNKENAKLSGSMFRRNIVCDNGGAVYFNESDTLTDNCIFNENGAKYGGAIYYDDVRNTLRGSGEKGTVIEGNYVRDYVNYGHGVFVNDTDITLGGRLIIRNNGNIDINKISDITEDKIPTWSNLCLYDYAVLDIDYDAGSLRDSEIWLDSDWGHYKKPAGGFIYRDKTAGIDEKLTKFFKSDRSGFHFINKNRELYYEEEAEKAITADLPAPTVSIKPTEEKWMRDPGRVFIDFDCPYDKENIEKHYTVKKQVNDGDWETVKVENDGERDYVDVNGVKGKTELYEFDLSYTVSLPSPSGGMEEKTSEKKIVTYCVENQILTSRVYLLSAYESFGELVKEDLGKGAELSLFEYSGMRYPVVNEGQEITGWKLHVDGEEDRDIDVDFDKEKNSIKFTLPDDLNGRDVLIIPQREARKCTVKYVALSSEDYREIKLPEDIKLPDDKTVVYGSKITIEPIGDDTGLRSIGSFVNGKATWGRESYTADVKENIEVEYIFDERLNVTVTFDDELIKSAIGEKRQFKPGQSFIAAGLNPADSRYKMNEIDHFQVLHEEEKTDEDGNVIMEAGEPVKEEVFNENLTLGVNDPMLNDQTLKPVWTQTVKLNVACRSTDGILADEMELAGGSKDGESITADVKTGGTVKVTCQPPEGKRFAGWTVAYYTWHSAMSPGWIDSIAIDNVKSDGQKIATKVNSDGTATYSVKNSGLEFNITKDMKAVKTNTPLRINITPVFKDVVAEISGVPDEMNIGDVFDLSTVKVMPTGTASASDIEWTVNDANGERELDGTYSPSTTGATMLHARIKDGLGIGSDYVQSFKVESGTVRLVFYEDMAGTKIGKDLYVDAGSSLAEYADTKPSEDPEDYSFAGWTFEPKTEGDYSYKETIGEDSILFDFDDNMPAQTLRLYPVFIKDRLRVVLDLGDGGSEVTPAKFGPRPDGEEQSKVFYAEINEKLQMEALDTATRPGYKLAGWYTNGGIRCTKDWAITPKYCEVDEKGEPVIGRKDNFDYYTLRLTAKWAPLSITVKYVADGKATEIKNAAEIGGKLVLAEAPEVTDDMVFDYWMDSKGGRHAAEEEFYLDDSAVDLIDENGVIEFTSWYTSKIDPMNPDLNMIVFATAGGTYIDSMRARAGEKIEAPADPYRAGYLFNGWKYNESEGFPDYMPAARVTVLTASWSAKESAIKFETNGGSAVADVIAEAGTDIRNKRPADPVKDHCEFAGWMPEYPDVMPENDVILYALWTPTEYTLTYDANGGKFADGEETLVQKGIYDSLVFVAGEPVRDGYTFSGWDSDIYSHMPGENKTIKAVWDKHEHDWGEPEYTIIGDLDKVEAKRVCKIDPSHVEKETASIKAEKKGDLIYYSAKFKNEAFSWSFEDDGQRGGVSAEYAKTHIVKAHNGTWLGAGASIKAADYKLTRWKSNSSPKGTTKKPLKLKATKKTKKSVKLKWNKVKTTKKYVIYGGKKGQKLKKIATTSKSTYTVKKIAKKKLKKNTQYRFIVVALDEFNFVNSTSKLVKAKTKKR